MIHPAHDRPSIRRQASADSSQDLTALPAGGRLDPDAHSGIVASIPILSVEGRWSKAAVVLVIPATWLPGRKVRGARPDSLAPWWPQSALSGKLLGFQVPLAKDSSGAAWTWPLGQLEAAGKSVAWNVGEKADDEVRCRSSDAALCGRVRMDAFWHRAPRSRHPPTASSASLPVACGGPHADGRARCGLDKALPTRPARCWRDRCRQQACPPA